MINLGFSGAVLPKTDLLEYALLSIINSITDCRWHFKLNFSYSSQIAHMQIMFSPKMADIITKRT